MIPHSRGASKLRPRSGCTSNLLRNRSGRPSTMLPAVLATPAEAARPRGGDGGRSVLRRAHPGTLEAFPRDRLAVVLDHLGIDVRACLWDWLWRSRSWPASEWLSPSRSVSRSAAGGRGVDGRSSTWPKPRRRRCIPIGPATEPRLGDLRTLPAATAGLGGAVSVSRRANGLREHDLFEGRQLGAYDSAHQLS